MPRYVRTEKKEGTEKRRRCHAFRAEFVLDPLNEHTQTQQLAAKVHDLSHLWPPHLCTPRALLLSLCYTAVSQLRAVSSQRACRLATHNKDEKKAVRSRQAVPAVTQETMIQSAALAAVVAATTLVTSQGHVYTLDPPSRPLFMGPMYKEW